MKSGKHFKRLLVENPGVLFSFLPRSQSTPGGSAGSGTPQAAAPANQNNPTDLQVFINTDCRQEEDGRGKGSEEKDLYSLIYIFAFVSEVQKGHIICLY